MELARRSKGPVLEYGVGNGRVALPIARQGVAITGIDLSAPMLADLREKLKLEEPSVARLVSARRGDMRKVKLKRRFPLVIAPFNVMLHLYDRPDMEAFLARVKEHLTPKGEFVFDYSLPQPADLGRDPNRSYRVPDFVDPVTKLKIRSSERFFYERFRQTLLVWSEYEPETGEAWDVPLTHRQFFPQEMEALLHYNGFEIIAYCPDFAEQGWLSWVDSLVVHCRVRPASGRKRAKPVAQP